MQRSIVLGQVSLSFYAVTGAVVQIMLERLGHSVEVVEGPHERIFSLLGAGRIDLMAAAWLPEGHADYWARYGQNALEVSKLYDGARFFWGVPDYVPIEDVRTIADLAGPAVAARINKRIQGIGMGAAISQLSHKAVAAYGLDHLGYLFHPGSQPDWLSAYRAALSGHRWMIFPTWAPQFLNRSGRIRRLDDPKRVLGGANRAVLVAPRDRWARLPIPTRAVLARLYLGIGAVTEMDWRVNVRGDTARVAAESWLAENPKRSFEWLGEK